MLKLFIWRFIGLITNGMSLPNQNNTIIMLNSSLGTLYHISTRNFGPYYWELHLAALCDKDGCCCCNTNIILTASAIKN